MKYQQNFPQKNLFYTLSPRLLCLLCALEGDEHSANGTGYFHTLYRRHQNSQSANRCFFSPTLPFRIIQPRTFPFSDACLPDAFPHTSPFHQPRFPSWIPAPSTPSPRTFPLSIRVLISTLLRHRFPRMPHCVPSNPDAVSAPSAPTLKNLRTLLQKVRKFASKSAALSE